MLCLLALNYGRRAREGERETDWECFCALETISRAGVNWCVQAWNYKFGPPSAIFKPVVHLSHFQVFAFTLQKATARSASEIHAKNIYLILATQNSSANRGGNALGILNHMRSQFAYWFHREATQKAQRKDPKISSCPSHLYAIRTETTRHEFIGYHNTL